MNFGIFTVYSTILLAAVDCYYDDYDNYEYDYYLPYHRYYPRFYAAKSRSSIKELKERY
jgi:hypothetical protein